MSLDNAVNRPSKGAILAWQAALFACCLLCLTFIVLLEPGFSHFDDRIIGNSAIHNVNPYYRNTVYVLAIIAALSGTCSLFLRLPVGTRIAPTAQQESLAWLLAACALVNALAALVIEAGRLYWQASGLAVVLLALLFVSQLAASKRDGWESNYFRTVCLSWQGASTALMVFSWPPNTAFWGLWLAGCALGLAITKCYPTKRYQGASMHPAKRQGALRSACGWLALSPLLFIAANELSYIASQRDVPIFNPAVIFALLSAATAAVFWRLRSADSPSLFLLGLCVLLSTTIINEYRGVILYRLYDLFHMGESVIPLQQWRDFGSLPYIDYLPVHGMFDLLPQFIYQQLTGSSPLEALIWGNGYFMGWLMRAVAIALVYLFLTQLIRPIYALFLLLLLPTYHLIEPYYCLFLLPIIHVLTLRHNPNPLAWWLMQWLLTASILLWRLDFGLVLIVGNAALAVLLSWYHASFRHTLSALISALALALGGLALVAWLVDGQAIGALLTVIKAYLSNQLLVASYAIFYREANLEALLQYVVLPGGTAIIAAFSLSRLLLRRSAAQHYHLDTAIVFVSAVTLVVSLRGLQRHSLFEGQFRTYLYLLVMLLLLVRYQPRLGKLGIATALALFIMGSYLLVPFGSNPGKQLRYHLDPKWQYPAAFSRKRWPHWQSQPIRLVDKVTQYDNLLAFMSQTLSEGQTFYDFSNAPLLYALAGVELPVYITETVYQSSDTLQQTTLEELEHWHRQQQLPFVVFRRNHGFWDVLDGVDNALRSYLIAEFIYRAYRPCLKIDNIDIWIDRRIAGAAQCQQRLQDIYLLSPKLTRNLHPLSDDYLEQNRFFWHVPYLWGRLDRVQEAIRQITPLTATEVDAMHWALTAQTPLNCLALPCYLDVTIESAQQHTVELYFSEQGLASFALMPGRHKYRIRASSLWHWHRALDLRPLTITATQPFRVDSVELVILQHAEESR